MHRTFLKQLIVTVLNAVSNHPEYVENSQMFWEAIELIIKTHNAGKGTISTNTEFAEEHLEQDAEPMMILFSSTNSDGSLHGMPVHDGASLSCSQAGESSKLFFLTPYMLLLLDYN